MALIPGTASPCVRLSWDDPGDTAVTHYRVLRRDADEHREGRFTFIDSDTGSVRTQYVGRSVENNMRYLYRIVAVNEHGESRRSRSAKADTYRVATVPFPGSVDPSPEN